MRLDETFSASLKAISDITLRDYPETASMYTFHEGFRSDIRGIRSLCKERRTFGHSCKYFNDRWDLVLLLADEFFMFYLPAVLLACLDEPDGNLAATLAKPVRRRKNLLTDPELVACERVLEYVSLVTSQSNG